MIFYTKIKKKKLCIVHFLFVKLFCLFIFFEILDLSHFNNLFPKTINKFELKFCFVLFLMGFRFIFM